MNETTAKNQEPERTAATEVAGHALVHNPAVVPPAVRKAATAPVTLPPLDPEEDRQAQKVGALVMSARRALRRGNREEARSLLKQSFAIQPKDIGAIELLGEIYMEEGEQETAIKVFERGLTYHPGHPGFEERIALCHLDLAEMQRAREARQLLLNGGDLDGWVDLKPNKALGLSLMLPGAGQVYNEEITRGAAFFVAMVVTLCGWFLPLYSAMKSAREAGVRQIFEGISVAIGSMSGFGKFMFWAMLLAWIAVYILAAIDGMMGAERANEARRRTYGI